MDIADAAEALQAYLERFDWLTAVGVGEHDGRAAIFVYLKRPARSSKIDDLVRHGWKGYPVVIDRVGTVWPAKA